MIASALNSSPAFVSFKLAQHVERGSTLHDVYLQVVVVDKLDYCATLNNLTFTKDNPNFKVRVPNVAGIVHAWFLRY